MLRGIKLSSKKLHSINEVPFFTPRRRRNPVFITSEKDITGDVSLDQMKRLEKSLFGKALF